MKIYAGLDRSPDLKTKPPDLTAAACVEPSVPKRSSKAC